MANTWDVGDEPRLFAIFVDSDDLPQSPTAAVIVVKKPADSILSYKSATGFSDQGDWDASANSPTLADGIGTAGDYYTVSVAGTQTFGDESLSFAAGDQIYYNGKVWRRLQNVQATTLTKVSFSDQGNWDASTNSPTLADGTGTAGDYYTVSVAGSKKFGGKTLSFAVNDYIYYNGKIWKWLPAAFSLTDTGIYYVDQYLTLSGKWWYASDGIGARTAAEDYFTARAQVAK